MVYMMKKRINDTIEILAPAKNLEYGKEAVLAGADSVYIGTPKFSLRKYQANSLEDINELIKFAHKYYARVYAAVNCLLFTDDDLMYAENLIKDLYKMGIDGIIVQDKGILELEIPPVPVILSTNAMCFTKEEALFYEKCGVSKIVLPRELSSAEIKDITQNTNIEIEAFCCGFLCAGISGNCYLAYTESLKNTKSCSSWHYLASNHGVCPERCMGNWTLKDAGGNIIRENDRLLNVEFLDLLDELERLFDTGVSSFKIAGREKDLKHVKNLTAMYSMKADEIAAKKGIKRISSGRTILGFTPGKYKNFNKGFTDFFLNGRKKEMYSKYDVIGEPAGIVKECSGNSFIIDTDIKISIGDKFRYKTGENPVKTFEIENVQGNKYTAKDLNDDITGIQIYRYYNFEGFREAESSENYRVISVKLSFSDTHVKAEDEDGNTVSMPYKKGSVKLENPVKDLHYLNKDCEFLIDEVCAEKGVYIDDKEEFRNALFALLRLERGKNRPVRKAEIVKNNEPYYKKELSYLDNVTNKKSEAFFRRHGVQKIAAGLETSADIKDKRVFTSKYCLRNELGVCSKTNPQNMPKLPWTIEQLESGISYKIDFDCSSCRMYFYCNDEDIIK